MKKVKLTRDVARAIDKLKSRTHAFKLAKRMHLDPADAKLLCLCGHLEASHFLPPNGESCSICLCPRFKDPDAYRRRVLKGKLASAGKMRAKLEETKNRLVDEQSRLDNAYQEIRSLREQLEKASRNRLNFVELPPRERTGNGLPPKPGQRKLT